MFSPTKLNYSQVPYIPWKGKSFTQVTSSIQRNRPTDNIENAQGPLLFKALPLKIYRRELASAKIANCSERISASIDEMNSPGGYLVNPGYSATPTTPFPNEGILGTVDLKLTNNKTELPGQCSAFTTNGVCLDPGRNALKRVRSAGMIRKQFNPYKNVEPYCTTSQQYLNTRGRTFDQNQFNYLKKGDRFAKPGTNASQNNEYAVNTNINYCEGIETSDDPAKNYIPVYYKPNNPQFAQEGAVSSSARITRLNYNTITSNGALYSRAYGNQVGNAMSYGVASDAYTVKAKIGYPNICVPRFSNLPNQEGFSKCDVSPLNNNSIVPGPLNI